MPRRFFVLVLVFLFNSSCNAWYDTERSFSGCKYCFNGQQCSPSSCGKVRDIRYPFRLKTDPHRCGIKAYSLSCENNVTTLNLYSEKYIVEAIDYDNRTIRIADPNIHKGNCSSLPRYSLSNYNFSYNDPYKLNQTEQMTNQPVRHTKSLIFVSCENPVLSPLYIDTASCDGTRAGLPRSKRHAYVLVDGSLSVSEMVDSCSVDLTVTVSSWLVKNNGNTSFMDIHHALAYGIELSWERFTHLKEHDENMPIFFVFGMLGAKLIFGTPLVLVFWIYIKRKQHFSMFDHIEQFLQSCNNLMPIRYSYSRLRKMANGFKDALGEGGYGSVYRGMLCSGRLVAIKMLDKSKSNGEDFINEVATIGRIHHVNVVQLVGFCVEGSKRALVYDYMPMGSLDKHIFSREGTNSISCKKMFEISLGVARGIEYLHRGCEMQILHFDIKPHNILLDENFVPKISDFGLARLCPPDGNSISLTAARGTLGYIAPELLYKNIGGVSYKADVYSFGMLLMEMTSRRKNLNTIAEHTSQIYFPSWAHDKLSEEKSVAYMEGVDEEDLRRIKKMVMVALWCIQVKPSDRPSMSKVIEMLEGDVKCLQMPPKPSLYPQEKPVKH